MALCVRAQVPLCCLCGYGCVHVYGGAARFGCHTSTRSDIDMNVFRTLPKTGTGRMGLGVPTFFWHNCKHSLTTPTHFFTKPPNVIRSEPPPRSMSASVRSAPLRVTSQTSFRPSHLREGVSHAVPRGHFHLRGIRDMVVFVFM